MMSVFETSDQSAVSSSYRRLEESRSRARETGRWKEDRNSSPVSNLRAHHNWLKAGLIQAFVRPGDRVLDVCCGSGGDVRKCRLAGAKRWDGFDVCDARVEEARRRCRSEEDRSRAPSIASLERTPTASGEFRATARRARAEDVIDGKWRTDYYDCVVCFFALHYFWDERDGRNLVRGLRRLLYREAGTVMVILPCSKEVESRFARSPSGFGNAVYRCDPSGRPGEYRFWLADSVTSDTPERVVPVGSLLRDFGEAGFACELALKFEQLDGWLKSHPKAATLTKNMRPTELSEDEKQVSSLYVALVFTKS
jgi:mRNA (guanine-N7-)-methyltransferase